MAAMLSFATLVVATLLATGAAVLLDWLMLRAAFHLMQPRRQRASQRAVVWGGRPELVRGTVQVARAYGMQP